MIAKLFIVLLFILTTSLRAATFTASSCSSADFTTALSSAIDGDTVLGPNGGGSATWSSVVTVNHGITLNGNGCSVTFTRNSGGLTLNTDSVGTVLTDFTFLHGFTGGAFPITINLASTTPYNAVFRMYNITLTDDASGGTLVGISGFGPMLVDHVTTNTATNAAETWHILGGGAGCSACWNLDMVPGSENMVIFENDVWTETNTANYCQIEEGFYGAVWTLRYSTFNYCQNDSHGAGPSNRWVEIYNNTYNHCCNSGAFFDFRGGSGVYWGNTSNLTRSGNTTNLGPICGSSDACGTYPVQYQFGEGIAGTHYSPVYIWGSGIPQQSGNIFNRDASMVQVGTAPNDPSNCSGLSGNLCNAIVTTSQPATLERCQSAADVTSGCPVSYAYVAYTYPHPLDNCLTSQYGSGATCGSNLGGSYFSSGSSIISGTTIQ